MNQQEITDLHRNMANEKKRRLVRELRQRQMTASEIPNLLAIPLANLSRDYLDDLSTLGLIEAHIDPNDTRRRVYRVTNLGIVVDDTLTGFERLGPVALPPTPPPPLESPATPTPQQTQTTLLPPAKTPIPYLLFYNSGYIIVWGLFLKSVRDVIVQAAEPWVPYAWFFIAAVASVIWYRLERGFLRRTFPPPKRSQP